MTPGGAELERCRSTLAKLFEVVEERAGDERLEIVLGSPIAASRLESALIEAYKKVVEAGCYPAARRDDRGLVFYIFLRRESPNRLIWAVGLGLLTLVSVYVSGLLLSGSELSPGGIAWTPISYLAGLLVPLIIHELGHWSVMRSYKTPASIPFLLPAPPLQLGFLGTFGAVINLRWLPPSSDSLVIMAVAGPLAGFIAVIPFTIIGAGSNVFLSEVEAAGLPTLPLAPLSFIIIQDVVNSPPEGYIVALSPLSFAAYVVFFVTFLNLIPVGMLDGGHIVRGVMGPRLHSLVSLSFVVTLLLASVYYPGLGFFAIIALILYLLTGGRHPGPALRLEGLTWKGAAATVVYCVLLVLTLPIPV